MENGSLLRLKKKDMLYNLDNLCTGKKMYLMVSKTYADVMIYSKRVHLLHLLYICNVFIVGPSGVPKRTRLVA